MQFGECFFSGSGSSTREEIWLEDADGRDPWRERMIQNNPGGTAGKLLVEFLDLKFDGV